jgi:hypothetical protein
MESAPMRTDLTPETTRFEKVHAGLATLRTRQGAELRNALRFSPQAEGIIIQRLLELQALVLPDKECVHADRLMDRIAKAYLSTCDSETRLRRIHHLLLICHVRDANESSN